MLNGAPVRLGAHITRGCKSRLVGVTGEQAACNCVAARRGGEQQEENDQAVGDELDSAASNDEPAGDWRSPDLGQFGSDVPPAVTRLTNTLPIRTRLPAGREAAHRRIPGMLQEAPRAEVTCQSDEGDEDVTGDSMVGRGCA